MLQVMIQENKTVGPRQRVAERGAAFLGSVHVSGKKGLFLFSH